MDDLARASVVLRLLDELAYQTNLDIREQKAEARARDRQSRITMKSRQDGDIKYLDTHFSASRFNIFAGTKGAPVAHGIKALSPGGTNMLAGWLSMEYNCTTDVKEAIQEIVNDTVKDGRYVSHVIGGIISWKKTITQRDGTLPIFVNGINIYNIPVELSAEQEGELKLHRSSHPPPDWKPDHYDDRVWTPARIEKAKIQLHQMMEVSADGLMPIITDTDDREANDKMQLIEYILRKEFPSIFKYAPLDMYKEGPARLLLGLVAFRYFKAAHLEYTPAPPESIASEESESDGREDREGTPEIQPRRRAQPRTPQKKSQRHRTKKPGRVPPREPILEQVSEGEAPPAEEQGALSISDPEQPRNLTFEEKIVNLTQQVKGATRIPTITKYKEDKDFVLALFVKMADNPDAKSRVDVAWNDIVGDRATGIRNIRPARKQLVLREVLGITEAPTLPRRVLRSGRR